jgi:hypothetical protein
MVTKRCGDRAVELVDLLTEGVDQHEQGRDALPVCGVEPRIELARAGQQFAATDPEQIGHRYMHAMLGQHGVDLCLESGPEPDELGPVADQFSPLTDYGGRDPGFGEHVRPQQIPQNLAVALVVLDSPPLERRQPRRCDQMHPGASGLQRIDSPIASVGPGRSASLSVGLVPRPALPNRTCEFPRIRLSTSPCRLARRLPRRRVASSTASRSVRPDSDTE